MKSDRFAMKKLYSEYNNHKINLENLPRKFSFLPQVSEFGYITGCVGLPLAERIYFRNKLEFCLRISCSQEHLLHTINDVKYENTYPHCLVKPPLGSYRLKDITRRDVFYIIYPADKLAYFRKAGIIDDFLCWDIELTPAVSSLINILKEMINDSMVFGFSDQVDLRCIQLIHELVLIKKMKEKPLFFDQSNIKRIISYFNLHYCDNFSLDELIKLNGFSRSSFFRHWSKFYKVSPAKYMMNLRIEEAKRLLIETESSIDDVARLLKFCSTTYFCSIFKKLCGCSPLQFRIKKRIYLK